MLSRNFLILLLVLFINGCSSTPVAVAKPKALPDWIERPLNSDSRYIYGTAIAQNRDEAIKAALVDMMAKLGTTIESRYESTEELEGSYYYKLTAKSQISSRVEKIKVNNYEVVKSHRISYREFAVMLRSDKKKFVSGLKESLKNSKKSIEDELSLVGSKNALARYNSIKTLHKRSLELHPGVVVVSELDRGFKKQEYLDFIAELKNRYLQEKSDLSFYMYGDSNSKRFIDSVTAYLSKAGFKIVERADENSIHVRFKTTEDITKSNSINIAVLTLGVNVSSNSQTIGGKTYIIKERFNGSRASLYKNASIHFEEDIDSYGINELIGINLDLE